MSCWRTNYPIDNAYIAEFYPDTNFGESPYLYVKSNAGDDLESLLKFEVHHEPHFEGPLERPEEDFLEDEEDRFFCRRYLTPRELHFTLRLWIFRNDLPTSTDLLAFETLNNWDDDTVTWNTRPAAGLAPIGSVEIASGQTGWIDIDLGELSGRHGLLSILLRSGTANNGLISFYSTEFEDSAFWPQLLATFVEDETEKPVVAVSGPPIQISPNLVHVRRRRIDRDRCDAEGRRIRRRERGIFDEAFARRRRRRRCRRNDD